MSINNKDKLVEYLKRVNSTPTIKLCFIFGNIFKEVILKSKATNLFGPFIKVVEQEFNDSESFQPPFESSSINGSKKIVQKWPLLIWKGKEGFENFKDPKSFEKLKNKFQKAFDKQTKEGLNLIIRTLILFDPSKLSFDDKDIDRILGDYGKPSGSKKKLIQKCTKLFSNFFKNVQFYNPSRFSNENRKGNFNREDGLFALAEAINRATIKLSHEESSHLWMGKKILFNPFDSKGKDFNESDSKSSVEKKSKVKFIESNNYPKVMASKGDLNLYFNSEDYHSHEHGITRGEKTINLNKLKEKFVNIFPLSQMKSGEARIIDLRSISIECHLPLSHEKLDKKCKIYAYFVINIFKDFAGCFFKPSQNFVETI